MAAGAKPSPRGEAKGCAGVKVDIRQTAIIPANRISRVIMQGKTKQRSVPQWYMKYNTLKSEAKHYKIDISE